MATVTVLVVLLVICIVTAIGGRVVGLEFSPTHFTARNFQFYEIPWIQLQVTPIQRTAEPVSITNLLRSQNFITVPTGSPDEWDLVQISRGPSTPSLGDSELLYSHLKLSRAAGSPVWETWSRDHPAAAAVFWPVIKRLAERELYLLIPDLFVVAERESDPTKLAAELDQELLLGYQRLIDDLIAANQPQLASNLLVDALRDFPENDELLERRRTLDAATSEG